MRILLALLIAAVVAESCDAQLFRRNRRSNNNSQRRDDRQRIEVIEVDGDAGLVVNNYYPRGTTLYGAGQVAPLHSTNPALGITVAGDQVKAATEALTKAIESGQVGNADIAQLRKLQVIAQVLGDASPGRSTTPDRPGTPSTLIAQKCAKCHSGDLEKPKGGFALKPTMPAKSALRAIEILDGTDVPKPMRQLVSGLSADDRKAIRSDLLNYWRTK